MFIVFPQNHNCKYSGKKVSLVLGIIRIKWIYRYDQFHRTAMFRYLNWSLCWYCTAPRQITLSMVGTANKNISHINYLKMKLCFGRHRSMLFLSRSQNFRSYWKTLLLCVIGIQFTVLLLRKSNCPYGIQSRK